MNLTPERTRCHGILWHQDTEWQRCPKADDCARYRQRFIGTNAGTQVEKRVCKTDERERFLSHE